MMVTDINNIFKQSSCLTKSEIEHYVSGTLNEKAIRKVELHLADCPMCSDEIDGYNILNDKNKLSVIVKELNFKTDTKIKASTHIPLHSTRKKSITKRIISIAASLILLLGAGYIINFYMKSADKNLADVSPKETVLKEDTIDKQAVAEKNTKNEISESKLHSDKSVNLNDKQKTELKSLTDIKNNQIDIKESNQKVNNEEIEVSEDKNTNKLILSDEDVSNDNIETENIIVSSISEEKKSTGKTDDLSSRIRKNKVTPSENEQVTYENAKSKSDISFMTTRGGVVNSDKIADRKEIEKYKSLRESALLSYSMKIYDEAVKDFESYLSYKPKDYEILYKSGISNYQLKKYDKALVDFNKVLKEGINRYVDDAEWYKAKSLLSLGKNTEAKIILNKIIVKNGKYQNKALDVLNTLN